MRSRIPLVLAVIGALLVAAASPGMASAGTPPPVPHALPGIRTMAVDQSWQAKIPAKYRIAKITVTMVPSRATPKVTPAAGNIACQPYPTGYRQYINATNFLGWTLVHYEQDLYFCWSYDSFMLYGPPSATPVIQTHWGWSFGGEWVHNDFEPYPYIWHATRLGAFNFAGQGVVLQHHIGLDAYCYWDGSVHAGPHFGSL